MTQTKLKDFNQIIQNQKIHDKIELINLDWGWKKYLRINNPAMIQRDVQQIKYGTLSS